MMPPPTSQATTPKPSRTGGLVALGLYGSIALAFATRPMPTGPAAPLLTPQERQAILQMAQHYVEYRSSVQSTGMEQATIPFLDPSLTGPAPQANPRPTPAVQRRPLVMSNSAILRAAAENYPPRGILTRNGVHFLMLGKHIVREGKSFKAVVEDSSYEITLSEILGPSYTLRYQDATLQQTLPEPRTGGVRPSQAAQDAPDKAAFNPSEENN